MCLTCHLGLTDEKVLNDLSGSSNFSLWNQTSIGHLVIAATGFNGEEVRSTALDHLTGYDAWKSGNPLTSIIDNLKKSMIPHRNTEMLHKYLENLGPMP